MKRLLMVFIILTCSLCAGSEEVIGPKEQDHNFPDPVDKYKNYIFHFDNPKFDTIKSIGDWINANVQYVSDPNLPYDYWKPPYETLTNGGDCEDRAGLFIAIARYQFDVYGDMLIIGGYKTNARIWGHAIAMFNSQVYELGAEPVSLEIFLSNANQNKDGIKVEEEVTMPYELVFYRIFEGNHSKSWFKVYILSRIVGIFGSRNHFMYQMMYDSIKVQ